jgi:threonine synthase
MEAVGMEAVGMEVTGWRCAVCGAWVDIGTPFAWRCPRATALDPHHVLHLVRAERPAEDRTSDVRPGDPTGDGAGTNPFLRYGPRLAWWAFARANAMTDAACAELTADVAHGFTVTPFGRSDILSDELGVELWVKDETRNVAGSHKARHLVGILLHLRAAELLGLLDERPPLAIASCGNAALAAATLAARVDWPIDVYVPTWMDAAFGRLLDDLGARIHRCERRAGDPPGDPAMVRFREAVDAGAIPFSVQGPENAYCLDGGRTIGWEIADQAAAADVSLDRFVVQVGGGAFAACVGAGLGTRVRLDTVQAAGCAPLAAAWRRIAAVDDPEGSWGHVMRPWPEPHSIADGILDDETYDWIAVVAAMAASGGEPHVAPEELIVRAHELATAAGFRVSPTGSAGLAGVLAIRDALGPGERVGVVMSGVARDAEPDA